jgi:hypothetical protein
MNDPMDDLLRAQGRRWAAEQSAAPPSLEEAVRTTTAPRDHRARTAVALTVVAVAAVSSVAAIPLVRSLGSDSSDHGGVATAPTSTASSLRSPSVTEPLPRVRVLRQLTKRARSAATANQDRHATAEAVRTTYADAERFVLDGDTSSNPPGDTQVWVIQLHGAFTCVSCSTPARGHTPTGTAVALVINARTYVGYDFTITKTPHDLTKLGAPIQLPM